MSSILRIRKSWCLWPRWVCFSFTTSALCHSGSFPMCMCLALWVLIWPIIQYVRNWVTRGLPTLGHSYRVIKYRWTKNRLRPNNAEHFRLCSFQKWKSSHGFSRCSKPYHVWSHQSTLHIVNHESRCKSLWLWRRYASINYVRAPAGGALGFGNFLAVLRPK